MNENDSAGLSWAGAPNMERANEAHLPQPSPMPRDRLKSFIVEAPMATALLTAASVMLLHTQMIMFAAKKSCPKNKLNENCSHLDQCCSNLFLRAIFF